MYNLYIEAHGGMLKYMNWYVLYGKYGKQVCIMDSHMVSPSTIDRRPDVCSNFARAPGNHFPSANFYSVLACKWQTLKEDIYIVRCKQFACSEPGENIP